MTLTFSVNGLWGIVIGDSAWGSIAGVRTCAWDSRKLCRLEPLDLRPNSLCKRPLCFGRIQISRLLVYRFWNILKRCIEYELFNKCGSDIRFKVYLHVTYFSRPVSVITTSFTARILQVSVCPRGGGVPAAGGAWSGVPARGGLVPGGCLLRGVPGGGPAPPRLLLRAVRILLECIHVKCVLPIVIKITEKNWSVRYLQSPLAQF